MTIWYPAEPARRELRRLTAGGEVGTKELARLLHLDRRTIQRVLTKRRLREDAADHIAVALGHHPCELWPEWFDYVPEEDSDEPR